jgi:hypothetical protein
MSCAVTRTTVTPEESLLTIPEAADSVGIKRRALYNRIHAGEIVPVQTPAGWRIDPRSIEGIGRKRAPQMRADSVLIKHHAARGHAAHSGSGNSRRGRGPTRPEIPVSAAILESIADGLPTSANLAALAAQMAARLRQHPLF